VSLPPLHEPEPDGAIVRGGIDDYLEHAPLAADLCCVVEVADSSLSIDLGPKLKAYASAGIPQYVVADLVNDRLLVHEEPVGDAYTRVITLSRDADVPLRAGEGRVPMRAERLLP
jgi:Uma2 family endonuclease